MRLTSELVQQSPAILNCLGDRTLLLRNLSIPAIENLAVARDSFDTIDLSGNLISSLGDTFPPFPRLKTLLLGGNRITGVSAGLAQSLPNLTTLVLTGNRIETVEDLNVGELRKLGKLEVLCIGENRVAEGGDVREVIRRELPQVRVLDFVKVRRERGPAREGAQGRKRKRAKAESGERKRSKVQEGNGCGKGRMSEEERGVVKGLIEKARSVEELGRIQKLVREGRVKELFG